MIHSMDKIDTFREHIVHSGEQTDTFGQIHTPQYKYIEIYPVQGT